MVHQPTGSWTALIKYTPNTVMKHTFRIEPTESIVEFNGMKYKIPTKVWKGFKKSIPYDLDKDFITFEGRENFAKRVLEEFNNVAVPIVQERFKTDQTEFDFLLGGDVFDIIKHTVHFILIKNIKIELTIERLQSEIDEALAAEPTFEYPINRIYYHNSTKYSWNSVETNYWYSICQAVIMEKYLIPIMKKHDLSISSIKSFNFDYDLYFDPM